MLNLKKTLESRLIKKKIELMDYFRKIIDEIHFINAHKFVSTNFMRQCTLSMKTLIQIILQKSVKSLQNVLNELFSKNMINALRKVKKN